jgi:response regulator RpfG family c-di-GMP phosphodiesterase
VLNAVRRTLRSLDINLVTLDNPYDAFALVKQQPHAVVADFRMSGMTGLRLLRLVKEISPTTVRILFTAFADTELVIDAVNKGEVFRFIRKPWDEIEFQEVILNAIEFHDVLKENQQLLATVRQQNDALREIEKQSPGIAKLPPQDEGGAFIIEPPELDEAMS